MPKRTIALISIIGIIAILLVIAAFIQMTRDGSGGATTVNETPTQETTGEDLKKASLSFIPSSVSASAAASQVEIVADTGGLGVTGVQVELEYDPTKISNVQLVPAPNSLFGTNGQVLIEELRPETGRISYAVVISPSAEEVKGIGSIIGLSFTAVPGATGTTEIKFLEKSLVTVFGASESVLKGTVPLTITLPGLTQPTPLDQGAPQNPQDPILQPTQPTTPIQ